MSVDMNIMKNIHAWDDMITIAHLSNAVINFNLHVIYLQNGQLFIDIQTWKHIWEIRCDQSLQRWYVLEMGRSEIKMKSSLYSSYFWKWYISGLYNYNTHILLKWFLCFRKPSECLIMLLMWWWESVKWCFPNHCFTESKQILKAFA